MLPQVSGQPGNATGAAAATAMNSRWNAGATIFFASVERLEESSSILRMLLQNPVLGMRETPRLKTRFLLPCWIRKPAVPYGTGKLTVRHVSPAYQRRISFGEIISKVMS